MRVISKFAAGAALLALCACASAAPLEPPPAPGPALYVVRDADSTLYLYGTIHVRHQDDAWGSPAVEAALDASEEIWTEVEISPQVEARTQALALRRGLAPPDRPLSSWLTPEERERLAATARRVGLEPQALEPLQPWLASLALTVLPIVQAGYDPDAGVDRAVDAYGDAHGKIMRAFETPEQQVGLLADLPNEVQRQMLLEAIDEADTSAATLDQMSAAWEQGDLATLEHLLNEDLRDEFPEVYEALIVRRNNAWIETLRGELAGAGVDFVAVGAAHLVGEDGLVALLQAQGFRVERARADR